MVSNWYKPVVYICLILTYSQCRSNAVQRPEWMDLIPDKDLQPILAAQAAANDLGISFNDASSSSVPGPDLFQGDLRGCKSLDDPPCPPITGPLQWRRNIYTSEVLIQYTVSASLSGMLDLILSAQQGIENQTCLLFDENVDDENHYISYKPGERCSADWGGMSKKELQITLNKDCVDNKVGNIQNLLLQALGFPKEHIRKDRDNYIKIYWENVFIGRELDFRVDQTTVAYDDPYDYESVLHPTYFFLSKSPFTPTITGTIKVAIGQRIRLSVYDVMKINRTFCGAKSIRRTSPSPASSDVIQPSKPISTIPEMKLPSVFTVTQVETQTVVTTVQLSGGWFTSTVTQKEEHEVLKTVYKTVTVTAPPIIRSVTEIVNTTAPLQKKYEKPILVDEMNRPVLNEANYGNGSSLVSQIISPTPTVTLPCPGPGHLVTSVNLQTLSRSTLVGPTTSWEHSTKMSTVYLPVSSKDSIDGLLAAGPVYAEFEGPVLTVQTTRLNDAAVALYTKYESQTLPDGGIYQREKMETRSLICKMY